MSNEGQKKKHSPSPPSPSTINKKRKKIKVHPFPRCTLSPVSTVKSNFPKVTASKKVTKSNISYP
jgi:hypothetical protein